MLRHLSEFRLRVSSFGFYETPSRITLEHRAPLFTTFDLLRTPLGALCRRIRQPTKTESRGRNTGGRSNTSASRYNQNPQNASSHSQASIAAWATTNSSTIKQLGPSMILVINPLSDLFYRVNPPLTLTGPPRNSILKTKLLPFSGKHRRLGHDDARRCNMRKRTKSEFLLRILVS